MKIFVLGNIDISLKDHKMWWFLCANFFHTHFVDFAWEPKCVLVQKKELRVLQIRNLQLLVN